MNNLDFNQNYHYISFSSLTVTSSSKFIRKIPVYKMRNIGYGILCIKKKYSLFLLFVMFMTSIVRTGEALYHNISADKIPAFASPTSNFSCYWGRQVFESFLQLFLTFDRVIRLLESFLTTPLFPSQFSYCISLCFYLLKFSANSNLR